jgi:hypothetical protein
MYNHWHPDWDESLEWDEILRDDYEEVQNWERAIRAAYRRLFEEGEAPPAPTYKLKDLLDTFILEEEADQKAQVAFWNDSEVRSAAHDAAAAASESVEEARSAAGAPSTVAEALLDSALDVADAALTGVEKVTDTMTVPADIAHLSDSAVPFKSWHIRSFPETFEAPIERPLQDGDAGCEVVSPDDDGSIPAAIRKARAMIQPIPMGEKGVVKAQPAGTMAWTRYDPKKTEGWMYIEPKGAYADWLNRRMQQEYAARTAAYQGNFPEVSGDFDTPAKDTANLLAEARIAASVIAVMRQEGTPSAINTYDGTILTWGIGIAGPGRLPEVFYRIMKDPNIKRAFYLCGFRYEGTPKEGAYQIVDLTQDPPVVSFRDNFAHQERTYQKKDGRRATTKKGARDYGAYKALQLVADQVELLWLLIAVARDELTRETVFRVNYQLVEEMVRFGDHAFVECEALFVFISEVKHNWDIRDNMVAWAMKHLDDTEQGLPVPSPALDKAIAKGVFRFVLRHVQRMAWRMAVKELEVNVAKAKRDKTDVNPVPLLKTLTDVTYGFDRLVKNYWEPMQSGKNVQDGSALPVPDFPPVLEGKISDADTVFSVARNGVRMHYVVGGRAQCDFLFPHNMIELRDIDGDGNVILQEEKLCPQLRESKTWVVKKTGEEVK